MERDITTPDSRRRDTGNSKTCPLDSRFSRDPVGTGRGNDQRIETRMQRRDREGKRGAMADLGLRSILPSGLRIPPRAGFEIASRPDL